VGVGGLGVGGLGIGGGAKQRVAKGCSSKQNRARRAKRVSNRGPGATLASGNYRGGKS
jgi:hypothetical protein